MRAALLTACLLTVLAGAAAAQPKPAPHEVSPVTIYPARGHPKVMATFPAAGQAMAGGVLILTVTFDQQMSPGGFDLTAQAGGEPLPCLKIPRLLDDGKTFVLLCTLRAGRSYAVTLNGGLPSDGANNGFSNIAERRAQPIALAFTTTRADPVRSLDEAMKLEGLTALDIPVQEDPQRQP